MLPCLGEGGHHLEAGQFEQIFINGIALVEGLPGRIYIRRSRSNQRLQDIDIGLHDQMADHFNKRIARGFGLKLDVIPLDRCGQIALPC